MREKWDTEDKDPSDMFWYMYGLHKTESSGKVPHS